MRGEEKMKGVWEKGQLVGFLILVGDRFSDDDDEDGYPALSHHDKNTP